MKTTVALVALLLLSSVASADLLELKNGSVLKGTYVGGTQENLRFEVNGDIQLVAVSDILALTFTGRSAATQSSQAPRAPVTRAPAPSAPAAVSSTSLAGIIIPAGTRLLVRMDDTVDSKSNKAGDKFTAHLEADLVIHDRVVAPAGSKVYGQLAEVKKARRLRGKSELKLELTDLMISNQLRPIVTGEYGEVTDGEGRKTLRKVGVGAAVGAIIDGGDGAKKGAAIGGGLSLLTRGAQISIPANTLLEFRLDQPAHL